MKYFLLILFLSGFARQAAAQQNETDSLKRALSGELPDTTRASVYKKLANMYVASSPDTSLEFSRLGIAFSREKQLKVYEGRCLRVKGDALEGMGNFTEALKSYLAATKIFEEIDDKEDLGIAYACMGVVYQDQEDYRQALNYTFKAKAINNSVQDTSELTALLANIGYCYYLLDIADSALYYTSQAYTLAKHFDRQDYLGSILQNLGLIELKRGRTPEALDYFYQSIEWFRTFNDLAGLSDTYLELAKIYAGSGKKDSAIYCGDLSYNSAREASYTRGIMDAGLLLASIYDTVDKSLAYDYYKVAMKAKDDLFSAEKIRQVTNLQFDEEERQRELRVREEEDKKERRENIQLAGIAIFIPGCFLLMMVLTRVHIRPKTLDFMGVVSTLMVFEFITLILHPRIVVWTHHQPILELLALMVVAAIVAPVHHRFLHWIKVSLAKMTEIRNRNTRPPKAPPVPAEKQADKN